MRPTRWNAAYVLTLSLAHAILWWWANQRSGVWLQVPAVDEAHDLTTVWLFHRALRIFDLDGLARTWVAGSSVHTPLIPFCSAVMMWLFGPSRVAAESILPVAIAVWIVAIYAIAVRLYDRKTAQWTAALATSFPVFLIYSRAYVFELPWAAVFALACWFLIESDGFRRAGSSLAFGVMAGFTALARGGGFVLLAGPVGVALWRLRAHSDRARRAGLCAGALTIGALLAATWYVPNFRPFYAYVRQATYGTDAVARTGRAAALSWDAVRYYATWLIAQGPGWPMLVVVTAGLLVTVAYARERLRPSATLMALGAAFAIDFGLLLVAMQRQTARYFLPLMPIVALIIVRIVQSVEPVRVRYAAGMLLALFGLHHVIALSITMPAVTDRAAAPYVRGVPLWDHRTYFKTLVAYYELRTPADDFRIGEIVQFLGTLPIAKSAAIAVVGPPHAFFHRNGLQLESIRQQREWRWLPDVYTSGSSKGLTILDADVVVLRENTADPSHGLTSFTEVKGFALGDGSIARIFVRSR